MEYSIWISIALALPNIVCYSVDDSVDPAARGVDVSQASRFIQRKHNSNGLHVPTWDSGKFGSFSERRRISERKCREYQYELSQQKLVASTGEDISSESQCLSLVNTRMSGGHQVEKREFPHMVSLGWFQKHLKFIHRCGGSLISEKWIITAAHCTDNFLKKRGVARLGITRLSAIKSGTIIGVVEINRHPKYKYPKLYADVALMKLARPAVFSDEIKPACLYSRLDRMPEIVWAAGWGSLEFVDVELQDNLRKVKLDVIDNLPCALAYKQTIAIPHGIAPGMLCAGDPRGGWKGDTCNGDSGGPLQFFDDENCFHAIVGITSFGKLCGTPDFPGVYTRVAYYLDWIESIVWPEMTSSSYNSLTYYR